MRFCVYILSSKKLGRYYVGTTDNIEERLAKHNTGFYEHSFSKKGIPWELFLLIDGLSSAQAYAIEKHIKSMKSSKYITNLKLYPEILEKLKEKYK